MIPEEAFPLIWPVGWPETKFPTRARFGRTGMGEVRSVARDRLLRELKLIGAAQIVISSDIPLRRDGLPFFAAPEPAQHGVAVYFRLKDQPRVLACDKWDKVADNMVALAKHVEAIRGQARWGVGSLEQALGGYKALAAMPAAKEWWEILGVKPHAATADVERRRLELLAQHHPDRGGGQGRAAEINAAWDDFRRERGLT